MMYETNNIFPGTEIGIAPLFFLLSELCSSEKHCTKVNSSQPTWVSIPCHYFGSPNLSRHIASTILILSHNISSNVKYFIQLLDLPQPLVLDWDEETLPEQVIQAKGFDIILYISPHKQSILQVFDWTYYFSTRMADVTYSTSSFPSLLHTLSSLVQLNADHSHSPLIVILGHKEHDFNERSS